MKNRSVLFITLFACLIGTSKMVSAADQKDAAMVAAGEAVFSHRCKACHSLDPAKNTFGPSLKGVIGRPAGTQPRFVYSRAMSKANITWTEANLRAWVADNEKLVPNTRMRHVAITDITEQDFLIAYLKSYN